MEKQALITAARCAKEWVDELGKNKKRPEAFHKMLKEMSQQVLDSDAETLVFTLTDLVDKTEKAESNTAYGKAFSKSEEKLERFSDALRQYAIDNDFDFIPAIKMDKSQRINVVHFSAVEAAQEGIRAARRSPLAQFVIPLMRSIGCGGCLGFFRGCGCALGQWYLRSLSFLRLRLRLVTWRLRFYCCWHPFQHRRSTPFLASLRAFLLVT